MFYCPRGTGLKSLLGITASLKKGQIQEPVIPIPSDFSTMKKFLQDSMINCIQRDSNQFIFITVDQNFSMSNLEIVNIFLTGRKEEVILMTPEFKQMLVGAYKTAVTGQIGYSQALNKVLEKMHIIIELTNSDSLSRVKMNFPTLFDDISFIHVQSYNTTKGAISCLQSELIPHKLPCGQTAEIFEKVYNDLCGFLDSESFSYSSEKYFCFIESAIKFEEK